MEAVLAELAAGNDIVGFECREVCADGSVRWFEWSTSSRPEAGIVYGVARDVTERLRPNSWAGQGDREFIDDLSAGSSKDVCSPTINACSFVR